MRVLERLDRMYAIGGGPGANRLGGTREEDEAHELVAGWMREAGLEVEVDPAGNLFGRLRGRRPELPEVWTGSHLDSVPNGGRFDGALGVVGGLEAVERLGRQERTLVVVAFRDEEGCSGPAAVARSRFARADSTRCRRPSSSCTSSRGRGSKRAGAPLGVVTGIAGHGARRGRVRGPRGSRGDDADGRSATTHSSPRRSSCSGSATRPRTSTARSQRSAGSRSSRARRT